MHAKTYISVVAIFFVMSISSALDNAFSQSTACTHYASPTGTGNGLSQSSPFKINNFWSLAKAGQTLCLLDGTYTGSSSMISPPQNLKGLPGSPITVKALNDGKVLIHGQGSNTPVMLYLHHWFVIEGVNACCSSTDVFHIGSSGNNILRRVTGWDASESGDYMIFSLSNTSGGGENNLLEDIAGWGHARKILESCCNANNTTVRRFWGSWDGFHYSGPKMTLSLAYNNYRMLVENAIGTWTGQDMKQTYTLLCPPGSTYSKCNQTFSSYTVEQPQGIFSLDGLTGSDKNANSKLLGSIAYIQGSGFPYRYLTYLGGTNLFEVKNVVAYIPPGAYTDKNPLALDAGVPGGTGQIASNLTSIGGAGPIISSDWQKSNIVSGASVGSIYGTGENIFNTSRGANLCYRYQDGALTKTSLWPWPMNQRIKDAMVASGRSPVDVTATIESMFGSIPASCKSGTVAVSKPSAPINLQAQK